MEAKKTKGRFIKKHDTLFKVVTVTEFSLGGVAKNRPTVADNTRANVFHRRLHDDESLYEGVKNNMDITQTFETADKSPVLRPIDFTEDWHRLKNRYSKRRGKMDEEEELEMELEYLQGKLRNDPTGSATRNSDASEGEEDSEEQQSKSSSHNDIDEEDMQEQPARKSGTSHIVIHHEDPDQQSEAASVPARPSRNPVSSLRELESDTPSNLTNLTNKFEPSIAEFSADAETQDTGEETLQSVQESEDPSKAESVGENPVRSGFRSLSSYIHPFAPRALTGDEQQVVEEAKSKGYEEGFKLGEEKATFQTKQMFSELTDTIEELVNDIASLKKNVLLNAQENFYVLCNALAQAIFKREIDLNPETLAEVIKRAIDEAVPEDEFKIILNATTADALKKVVPQGLRSKIRVDDSLTNGHFRIDSKLTVVDGNVSTLISDMIQQADLTLFEPKERAS